MLDEKKIWKHITWFRIRKSLLCFLPAKQSINYPIITKLKFSLELRLNLKKYFWEKNMFVSLYHKKWCNKVWRNNIWPFSQNEELNFWSY